MGIALEFGECSPPSFKGSHSSHLPLQESNHAVLQVDRLSSARAGLAGNIETPLVAPSETVEDEDGLSQMDWRHTSDAVAAMPTLEQNTIPQNNDETYVQYETQSNAQRQASNSQPQHVVDSTRAATETTPDSRDIETETPLLRSALSQPPLLAILDRWRTVSTGQKTRIGLPSLLSEARNVATFSDEKSQASNASKLSLQDDSPREISSPRNEHQTKLSTEPNALQPVVKNTRPLPGYSNDPLSRKQDYYNGDYTVMLHRAGRAREIYLGSKAFNHWAERTAARLEKEAVARRHMIRFRCFLGWSQAPNSRSPAVDQLRAVTAVQKLQRAVACQEEQLRAAAFAIAETHRVAIARRVISQWLCVTAQRSIQIEAAYQIKKAVASSWNNIAVAQKRLTQSTAKYRQDLQRKSAAHRWSCKAQEAETHLTIGRHLGVVRPMFAYLGAWWEHSEVKKKADAYHANRVWTRAHAVFSHWNLSSRAQAFVCRNDYRKAINTLSDWAQATRLDRIQKRKATSLCKLSQSSAVFCQVEDCVQYTSKLENYASRARLYIMAKSFLHVLDHAYEARMASRKEELRQQLRSRYKEASSARKKRQFRSALDHWRLSARQHTSLHANAEQRRAAHGLASKLAATKKWIAMADQNQELGEAGHKFAVHTAVRNWSTVSNELAHRESQSWDMWLQRKQRQSLKSWSISSLQGSGRAHTAAMVQQRYEGDKRTRVFQVWRHEGQRRKVPSLTDDAETPRNDQNFNSRSSWRASSSRQPNRKYESTLRASYTPTTLLDTPTRWTSRPLAVPSSLAKPMPSVKETDEQSSIAPSLSDDLDVGHEQALNKATTSRGLRRSLVLRPTISVSTTPQAPLSSSTLRRSVHVRNQAFYNSTLAGRPGQSTRPTRSMSIRQHDVVEVQPSSYLDGGIQTRAVAHTVPVRKRAPSWGWSNPTTPSRKPMGGTERQESRATSSRWTNTTKPAPQPSKLAGPQRHDSRPLEDANESAVDEFVSQWN